MTIPGKLPEFLDSLAPVTAIEYQVRSTNGEILCRTSDNGRMDIPTEVFDQVARNVIDNRIFCYEAAAQNKFVCGFPMEPAAGPPSALLAYGVKTNGAGAGQKADQLQRHLQQTVTLIIENQSYQSEIQELALQLELSFEDLYLYSQISDQVKSLTLSQQMLNNIMIKIVENMHVEAAFITLPQRPEFDMEICPPKSRKGPDDWEDFLYRLQAVSRPRLDQTLENFIIINDSRNDPSFQALTDWPYRYLMVGVRHQEEVYGWIGMASFNLDEIFRQGELRMLRSMAEQLAIVIANTDLYIDLEQFTESMVRSLVYAIEAKDPYTRGHSERVHHFTMLMAQQLRLCKEDFETLKWAAILHDIGKIGISEKVLLKPGKLTEEEFYLIKTHPEMGGRILRPVPQLANSLGGIVHHHERYDGTGYPHGLRGVKIPLSARIIAVADTFDAITSNRTYRKAKSKEEAMQIIRSVSGTQLDPGVVAVFEQIYTQEAG